jgi:hypothetical protein
LTNAPSDITASLRLAMSSKKCGRDDDDDAVMGLIHRSGG